MADGKETFPVISEKAWWELRKRFQVSPPTQISNSYLANLLNITDRAAMNVRPQLRRIGLIKEDGNVEDRAYKWRDDEQYAEVCNEMREELYPSELRELYSSPTNEDRDGIARWFANRSKVGRASSQQMASFYLLLSEADASKAAEPTKGKGQRQLRQKRGSEAKGAVKPPKPSYDDKKRGDEKKDTLDIPPININIQVHISADADPTQIDKIFESMAKHLNIGRKTSNE